MRSHTKHLPCACYDFSSSQAFLCQGGEQLRRTQGRTPLGLHKTRRVATVKSALRIHIAGSLGADSNPPVAAFARNAPGHKTSTKHLAQLSWLTQFGFRVCAGFFQIQGNIDHFGLRPTNLVLCSANIGWFRPTRGRNRPTLVLLDEIWPMSTRSGWLASTKFQPTSANLV